MKHRQNNFFVQLSMNRSTAPIAQTGLCQNPGRAITWANYLAAEFTQKHEIVHRGGH
jgi:hypothetical protein